MKPTFELSLSDPIVCIFLFLSFQVDDCNRENLFFPLAATVEILIFATLKYFLAAACSG